MDNMEKKEMNFQDSVYGDHTTETNYVKTNYCDSIICRECRRELNGVSGVQNNWNISYLLRLLICRSSLALLPGGDLF